MPLDETMTSLLPRRRSSPLFEFSLRETRHTAGGARHRPAGPGWLRPAEQLRVHLQLSADENVTAEAATRQVRAECAARRLHLLRQALTAREQAANSKTAARRVHRAERRGQAALARARFTDLAVAAEVLRLVQVLTLTQTLARLDYATPGHAQQVLASLITPPTAGAPPAGDRPAAASQRGLPDPSRRGPPGNRQLRGHRGSGERRQQGSGAPKTCSGPRSPERPWPQADRRG
jgi:hypothetical protein